MKPFFLGVLLVLVFLSGVAWWISPRPVQDGKIVLTWCSDDNPARREQIDLFNRTHPRYRLQLDPANNGMEKVIVQSEAKVGPDLFDSYSAFQSSAFIKSGIAWDITDRLRDAGVDLRNDAWRAALPLVMHEGRVYGFPRNAGTDAVFYNRTLFEQNGVPEPKERLTAEEFLVLAKKLTVRDTDGRVKQFGFMFSWGQWQFFMKQWGGRMYSADGTRCEVDCPETVAAMQFLQDLVWKHNIAPTPLQESAMATSGGWGSGALTWFGGGRAAMAYGGRWWLCLLRDKDNYQNLKLGAVEVQFGPKRQYMGYCGVVMINKNSPRREQAFDFIKFMAGKEYNELINHQADALGPMKKYVETDLFLHDPAFPAEDFNQVWRDVMALGEPQEMCDFINGAVAELIINEQLDLLKNNQKSAEEAMKAAARQINAVIEKNLKKSKALKTRYDKVKAGKDAAS